MDLRKTNPKLMEAVQALLAKAPVYECKRTGNRIKALPISSVIDELLWQRWKNVSDLEQHLDDSGFQYAVADNNLNACRSSKMTGAWCKRYADGTWDRRPVQRATTLVTLGLLEQ